MSALSLADRGFVWRRRMCGAAWRRATAGIGSARREHKANTFSDFIAAAEMLVAEGYAAPGRIVAEGGSAGGLLVGAVANMRPELWAGIIAEVPFVDVLNTMLDGDPAADAARMAGMGQPGRRRQEDFRRIAGYAPYENVAAQAYPPILALAGLTDPRVTYWEPAKWVAKLRATKTDGNPLYLKTHMDAGHGGASGRFEPIKETALSYAFALSCVGLA